MSAALKDIITSLGLTSGLKLCLDGGDANSYSGSGQSWLDTSGNGYDFFRGATGSAASDDPTFNGTAGRRSSTEYWSFDGGDFFRYHTTNETWMQNLHKDNAKFTLWAWIYFPTLTTISGLFGTGYDLSHVGIYWAPGSSARMQQEIVVWRGGGSVAINTVDSTIFSANGWHNVALTLDEAVGSGGGGFFTDGIWTTFTSTYSSPSASPATYTAEIGALGNGVYAVPNNSRLGLFAAWEGVALTQAQLNALYYETLPRFGPGRKTPITIQSNAVTRAAVY